MIHGTRAKREKWLVICKLIGMNSKKTSGAAPYVPSGASLQQLCKAVQQCKGCDLYRNATQAVFGEGPSSARIVMVGEQPGDKEDLAGKPFVGPLRGNTLSGSISMIVRSERTTCDWTGSRIFTL